MDVFEAIKGRRSIRNYKDKPVEDEKIGMILEACRWAPSAGNRQPWEVVVVNDPDEIESLAKASYEQTWISMAPVVFAICINEKIALANYGKRGEMYALETIGCATQNMMLAAYSLGLGSCCVTAFEEDRVREILGCPEFIRPAAILPVGYPDENPPPPYRDEIGKFTYLNKYGKEAEPTWSGLVKYGGRIKKKILKTLEKI
ncbi:MAG: nitroreductase family protein [Candidatus Aenigmarchaeota archaeon]|nr:nitroreductase family protein [Candidatus Aenigmarchaeota archaeon]